MLRLAIVVAPRPGLTYKLKHAHPRLQFQFQGRPLLCFIFRSNRDLDSRNKIKAWQRNWLADWIVQILALLIAENLKNDGQLFLSPKRSNPRCLIGRCYAQFMPLGLILFIWIQRFSATEKNAKIQICIIHFYSSSSSSLARNISASWRRISLVGSNLTAATNSP